MASISRTDRCMPPLPTQCKSVSAFGHRKDYYKSVAFVHRCVQGRKKIP